VWLAASPPSELIPASLLPSIVPFFHFCNYISLTQFLQISVVIHQRSTLRFAIVVIPSLTINGKPVNAKRQRRTASSFLPIAGIGISVLQHSDDDIRRRRITKKKVFRLR